MHCTFEWELSVSDRSGCYQIFNRKRIIYCQWDGSFWIWVVPIVMKIFSTFWLRWIKIFVYFLSSWSVTVVTSSSEVNVHEREWSAMYYLLIKINVCEVTFGSVSYYCRLANTKLFPRLWFFGIKSFHLSLKAESDSDCRSCFGNLEECSM